MVVGNVVKKNQIRTGLDGVQQPLQDGFANDGDRVIVVPRDELNQNFVKKQHLNILNPPRTTNPISGWTRNSSSFSR